MPLEKSKGTVMDWKNKRVLVTGAGGFIGSNVVEALVQRGATVSCFLRYKASGDHGALEFLPPGVREKLTITSGDLADPATAAALVEGQDIVIHLAALIGIPYSYIHPIEVVRTNTLGTAYLLEGCRIHGVERIVCFSTSEVYGTALYAPIDEEHPLQAQSPYAASKIGSDQIALSYFRSFGVPVAIVRPFNTFGPRQSSRAVIPTIITQVLRGGAGTARRRQPDARPLLCRRHGGGRYPDMRGARSRGRGDQCRHRQRDLDRCAGRTHLQDRRPDARHRYR